MLTFVGFHVDRSSTKVKTSDKIAPKRLCYEMFKKKVIKMSEKATKSHKKATKMNRKTHMQ